MRVSLQKIMYCKKSRAISNLHVAEGGCEGGCLDDLALLTKRSPRGCPAEGAGTNGDEGNACEFVKTVR